MKARVIRSSTPNCWYSEMVGDIFFVFVIEGSPYIWFSPFLHFYPEDMEIVEADDVDANMPQMVTQKYAA